MLTENEAEDVLSRLSLLFKRTRSMHVLPIISQRVIEAIDQGDTSAAKIEQLVGADPSLAMLILRAANEDRDPKKSHGVSSLRRAVHKLGVKSIRSLLALHNAKQISFSKSKEQRIFDRLALATHSLTTALVAKHIFVRKLLDSPFVTKMSRDDVFLAALLHDIGLPILARTAPDVLQSVSDQGKRSGRTLSDTFSMTYGRDLGGIAAEAIQRWHLPPNIVHVIDCAQNPSMDDPEFMALACVNYAHYLTVRRGFTIEPWKVASRINPDLIGFISLDEDELELVFAHATRTVRTLLPQDRRRRLAA